MQPLKTSYICDYFYCKITDDEFERKELSTLYAVMNPFISLYPLGGYIEEVLKLKPNKSCKILNF